MGVSRQGRLLVISGPAGSGKTTLCDRLRAEFPEIHRVVTTTSRPPRAGEEDGIDYHFVSPAQFQQGIEAGAFYEWARVHDRFYGSERREVLPPLEAGRTVLLNIDVQGAEAYRRAAATDPFLAGCLTTVFIKPRDLEQIRERLCARGTDDDVEIARRLATATEEIPLAEAFDEVITSSSREADYAAFRAIYQRPSTAR